MISRFDDGGGVCWVQVEIPVGSTFRRLYTGAKRFDPATFDIYSVPLEEPRFGHYLYDKSENGPKTEAPFRSVFCCALRVNVA